MRHKWLHKAIISLTVASTLLPVSVAAVIVPENRVNITGNGFVLSGPYTEVSGQPTAPGSIRNGNSGDYPEGSCLPGEFEVKNNSAITGDIEVSPVFDFFTRGPGFDDLEMITTSLVGNPAASADNLNDFGFTRLPLSAATSFGSSGGSIAAIITGPFAGDNDGIDPTGPTDDDRHYNILLRDVPAGDTVYVLFCARLNVDATLHRGATLTVRAAQAGGTSNFRARVSDLLLLPDITITKSVIGGPATPDQWSFTVSPAINGVSSYAIASGQTSVTIPNVSPDGSYSITESGPAGYLFDSGAGTNCSFSGSTATASVAAGDPATSASCTFNNRALPATLTVIKAVTNDDGGTLTPADFPLFVDGSPVRSGEIISYPFGTHAVSETSQSGYVGALSGDCDASGIVALAPGEDKTCTITNDDQPATITVIKRVVNNDAGTLTPPDFTMLVTGVDATPSVFPGSDSGTLVTLDAGPYSISEIPAPDYIPLIEPSCAGVIGVGEARTCTIINDDLPPPPPEPALLIVFKTVINDNGGSLVSANFILEVRGISPIPSRFLGSDAGTPVLLSAGAYEVVEDPVAGYLPSFSPDCSGVIAEGEVKTCFVLNDDQPAKLTVIKSVINDDGGTLAARDFTLGVTGASPVPDSFPGDESGTIVTLNAGDYDVTEIVPPGYAFIPGANCFGTIGVGESRTCTITNDDIPAELTVIKRVTNDDGGTLSPADFPLFVDAVQVNSGVPTLLPAGAYRVSETNQPGYTGTISGDCAADGTISLDIGEVATCTITNDDTPPPPPGSATLTVIKTVINDHGGTLDVPDFPLFIDSLPVRSGDVVVLTPGIYTVSEIGSVGYAAVIGLDCDPAGLVMLAPGDAKICLITNDDLPAELTVVKRVVNDNGGTLTSPDFTMLVSGTDASQTSFAGSEAGVVVTLDAGLYGVDEIDMPGYVKTLDPLCSGVIGNGESITCVITNDDDAAPPPPPPPRPAPPTLTVIKVVVNNDGGVLGVSDFPLFVDGFPVASGDTLTLPPGLHLVSESGTSTYAAAFSIDCDAEGSVSLVLGDRKSCIITNDDIAAVPPPPPEPPTPPPPSTGPIPGGGGPSLVVTPPASSGAPSGAVAGATVSAGSILVTVSGTDLDGNPIDPAKVLVSVTGNNPQPASFPGSASGTLVTLDPGPYSVSVSENSSITASGSITISATLFGFDVSLSAGCSGVIGSGDNNSCAISLSLPAPVPQVLGAVTELPRTGSTFGAWLFPALATLAAAWRHPSARRSRNRA